MSDQLFLSQLAIAQKVVSDARAAGLIDSLERMELAPAIRCPTDPSAGPLLRDCLAARSRLFAEGMSPALSLASIWMLDACTRGEPVEAARAFRTIEMLSALHCILWPTFAGGAMVGSGPVMEHLAEVSRLPGGDEALRIARQAVDQYLRCRITPESKSAVYVRLFQEQLLSVFGDPAVLRWRVIPWIRTETYERAIGSRWPDWMRHAEPSALEFEFDREWEASINVLPTLMLAWMRSARWEIVDSSPVPPPALPPLADAFMNSFPRRGRGLESVLLSDFALSCVLGVEEFRRSQGRLPASLGELVPAHLPTMPSRSLGIIYRTVQDPACPLGYQLYSMGFNGMADVDTRFR